MGVDFKKAKKYFGNIDFSDEFLTKKVYKELVKKFHPDNGGDEATMAEISAIFEQIKQYQKKPKVATKSELLAALRKIKKEIRAKKRAIRALLNEGVKVSNRIERMSKKIDKSLIDYLFVNRSKKEKNLNFMILLGIYEVAAFLGILILNYAFNFSLGTIILCNVCAPLIFFISFKFKVKKLKFYRNELTRYEELEIDLQKELQELEKAMSDLEKQKKKTEFKLADIEFNLNKYSA